MDHLGMVAASCGPKDKGKESKNKETEKKEKE